MRIVFSRKGFDSAAGGHPSPIVDGRPVSLPIPAGTGASRTTWNDLGLGAHVRDGDGYCHHDPMFLDNGTCLFGQCGAAQTHPANRGVGVGDVFVFFGLFRAPGERPHHRIFGYLAVEEVVDLATASADRIAELATHGHPHALRMERGNDAIYIGPGRTARTTPDSLRLSVPEESLSIWRRPDWLRPGGLSYHDAPGRWLPGRRLRAVSRGQEFVADVGRRQAPRRWLDGIITAIEA